MAKIDKFLAAAQKHIDKGNNKKAIKEYESIVEIAPDDARHHQKLADLYNREGHKVEAIASYTTVAEIFEKTGFETKALAVLKKVQQLDKKEIAVYYRLSDLNAKLGMVGNAVSELNALTKILEEKNDTQEIIDVNERLLALDPTSLNRAQALVESYLAESLNRKGGVALVKAINQFRERSEYVKACKLSEIFFQQFPDNMELKTTFSEVLVEMGETEKGTTLLSNLLKEDPDNIKVLESLVRCYKQSKNHTNERLTLNHLLKLTPASLDYKRDFLRSCADSGDKTRGLEAVANWEEGFKKFDRLGEFTPLKNRLEEMSDDEQETEAQVTDGFGDLDLTGGFEDEPAEEELVEEVESEDLTVEVEVSLTLSDPPGEVLTKPEPPPPPTPEDISDVEGSLVVEEPIIDEEIEADLLSTEPISLEADLEDEFLDLDVADSPDLTNEDQLVEEAIDHFSLDGFDIIDDLDIVDDVQEVQDVEEVDLPIEEPLEDILELIEFVEDDEIIEDDNDELIEDILDLDLELQLSEDEVKAFERNSELEEATFYFSQSLYDEAEQICWRLLNEDDNLVEAKRLIDQISRKKRENSTALDGGFFDLAAEIFDSELSDAFDSLDKLEAEKEDIEGTISAFREGVDNLISDEETEAHYDLGIAYREMGLFDDAIIEFTRAEKDHSRFVDCQLVKGECFAENGMMAEAEEALKSALLSSLLREDQKLAVMYQIAQLYEVRGKKEEALALFSDVAGTDPFYREVKEKIAMLKSGENVSNTDDKKSRISYM